MRRGPILAACLGCLLLAGITVVFLRARGTGVDRGRAPAPIRTRPPEAAGGPLAGLAPRLRGLLAEGEDPRQAEVTARILVDAVLDAVPPPPQDAIRAALRHEDWGVRWAGLLGASRYGPPDAALAQGIAPLLDSAEPVVRRAAAQAAAVLAQGFEAVAPALRKAAQDPDVGVRAAAVRTLAARAARRLDLVGLLERALVDEAADVRGAGAYGLAQIELQERLAPAVVERLVASLTAVLEDDASEVRLYAAMALGRAGPAAGRAAPALLGLLGDEHALVQSQAATALGGIGVAVLPAVDAALRRDRGERASLLLWTLRLLGEAAVPAIERATRHPVPVVRVHAALKIWELRRQSREILPILLAGLRSADDDAILQAARGVGRLGREAADAIPLLEALAGHADEGIRRAAAGALALIRDLR